MKSCVIAIACLMGVSSVWAEPAATQEGRTASPVLESEGERSGFRGERELTEKKKAEYEEVRKNYIGFKATGQQVWGEKAGVKTAEFYKKLSTQELADAVFLGGPVFWIEGGLHNDSMYALIKLEILHPGFEELFGRADMGVGVLHVYDSASAMLKADSDVKTVQQAMLTLSGMGVMMRVPNYRQYVKEHQVEVLQAHIQALERISAYLVVYQPEKIGTKKPFFGEAVWLAQGALVLAKEIDPVKYAVFEKEITSVRWGKEQNMDDVKAYLTLVVGKLKTVEKKPEG